MSKDTDESPTIGTRLGRAQDLLSQGLAIVVTVLVGFGLVMLVFEATSVSKFLGVIENNWKATVLLLAVLFFRPIRAFLERLESVGSVKAGPPRPEPGGESPLPRAPTDTTDDSKNAARTIE